jgi:two-component system sensor histidine kinase/response regulator
MATINSLGYSMQSASLPVNEPDRLRALLDLEVLDTRPEEEFEALVKIASMACSVPISLITLVDSDRQWFKANIGLPGVTETPRDISFCAHAILNDAIFEVSNAAEDLRFSDNPLVVSTPDIRFYAGAPIVMEDGLRIGTLCVIDNKPHQLTSTQREVLRQLAVTVSHTLKGRRAVLDMKRATQHLQEDEERWRDFSKSASDWFWETEASHRFSYFSENFEKVYGLPAGNLLGRNRRDILEVDALNPQESIREHLELLTQHLPFKNYEYQIRGSDGDIRWIAVSGVPHVDATGLFAGYRGTGTIITERKRIDAQLHEALTLAQAHSVAKSQFLANMSHEIRTPMNAILGMLSLLSATELNARQGDYASKAESAARSLLSLLNDILDFSKIEAGKLELDPQPFSFERLLRDLSVIVSSNLGQKPVEVLFDLDPTLPHNLVGDSLRLQQVLINLSGNALKFTERGTIVIQVQTVRQTADAATLRIAVKDSGIGISPENQKRLFSDFMQAEASTTRRFGGTGLGLSICKRLVSMMGGDLAVDSAEGEGSTFHFEIQLPISVNELDQDGKQVIQNSQTIRVLVVDDNAMARDLIAAMATSLGWCVDVAQGGAEALKLVQQMGNDYQAIFMDWDMPGMDGWETIERLRVSLNGKTAPITVMVTANGRESLSQRSAQEQAQLNAFLVKPITASMLREVVVDAYEGKSNLRSKTRDNKTQVKRLNGMRVLVVEDNLINQQVARELLSAEGARVQIADNGLLGVSAVTEANAATPFDVVLMDLQMPVMDGFEATKIIRKDLGLTDLPIVAMTANAMASDREACLRAGMNDHVGKPFDLSHLVWVLLRVSGYRAVENSPENTKADEGIAPSPSIFGNSEIDVEGALQRMSGMRNLYTRLVGDFVKQLDGAVPEFERLLSIPSLHEAGRHAHSLKGTASTLGAKQLAEFASHLETMCKSKTSSHALMEHSPALTKLVRSTQTSFRHVLDVLQPSSEQPVATVKQSLNKVSEAELNTARLAVNELTGLLNNSDLFALQRLAELRGVLSAVVPDQLDAVEIAMQQLDLEVAKKICQEMLYSIA